MGFLRRVLGGGSSTQQADLAVTWPTQTPGSTSADLSTTADVYAHLTSKMLERAATRMDRILAASG